MENATAMNPSIANAAFQAQGAHGASTVIWRPHDAHSRHVAVVGMG